jgi:Ca2+-binding EF-hand superfamily protein
MVTGINGGQGGIDAAALWQELLKRADKDGDGKISKEELAGVKPQGAGPVPDALFSKIDTNGDGSIDESENAAAVQHMQWGQRGHHRGMSAMKLFEEADTDKDGKISKSDFQAALGKSADSAATDQVFDAMDTNQDGFVSAAEYAAAMEKTGLMGQLFGQGQQGFSALA